MRVIVTRMIVTGMHRVITHVVAGVLVFCSGLTAGVVGLHFAG
jgi:hypothetical protein